MTHDEAAKALDGCEYGSEGSKELFAAMKALGLVAVFGASDDLMEFRGAVEDEVGCYDGGTAYFTSCGLLSNTCDNDSCPHEKHLRQSATRIDAKWDQNGYSWQYETAIPHSSFVVFEEGETYCEGIVFDLADVRP